MDALKKLATETPRDPYLTGPAFCLECSHQWECTAPAGTYLFECPNCKAYKGIWEGLAVPADDALVCNCGNDLFYFLRTGALMCLYCGREHEPNTE